MTEDRERELLRQIPTIRCTEELTGFREQLAAQGETPSAGLYRAMMEQSERLRK